MTNDLSSKGLQTDSFPKDLTSPRDISDSRWWIRSKQAKRVLTWPLSDRMLLAFLLYFMCYVICECLILFLLYIPCCWLFDQLSFCREILLLYLAMRHWQLATCTEWFKMVGNDKLILMRYSSTTLPLSNLQCSHTAIGPLISALLTAQASPSLGPWPKSVVCLFI